MVPGLWGFEVWLGADHLPVRGKMGAICMCICIYIYLYISLGKFRVYGAYPNNGESDLKDNWE